MNIELLCQNGRFPPDFVEFYKLHGVVTPKEDIIYSPRSITKNSQGKHEVLLQEIINPEVPIKHPILGISYKEPAWDLKRFVTLDKKEVTEEFINEIKHIHEMVEIIPKKKDL